MSPGAKRQWETDKPDVWVYEEIHYMYYEANYTWQRIGEWFGVPLETVRQWFREREKKQIQKFNREYWGRME